MKILVIFILISGQLLAGTTLKDAFQAARLNMETLRKADAFIEQKEARKSMAKAAMAPNVNGVGNYTRIDAPETSGVNSAFLLTRQYSAAIRLQQPLLRGGSLAAYQLAKEDILLAQFQKNASEINLYQLIINSYYRLHLAYLEAENLKELLKFSGDRVKELKSRTRVGRSRKGELVQAEAQLLAAESQFQTGNIGLLEAQQNFSFYTNLSGQELSPLSIIPREIPGLGEYLQKVKTRPDIMMKAQQVKVAEKQVAISKGGHYPSLDFVGNYYIDRTGVLQSSEWDAALVVSVPIFQGGGVQASVRESVEKRRVAELDTRESLRTAERDLRILHQNFKEITTQLDTLREAVKKAEEGYKLNLQDYRYGQVTNLDVLQSMNFFIETKRAYSMLLASAHMTYKNLEASVGVLP